MPCGSHTKTRQLCYSLKESGTNSSVLGMPQLPDGVAFFAMPGTPVLPEAVHKDTRFFFVEMAAESQGLFLQESTTAGHKVYERLHRGAIRESVGFCQELLR